MVRTKQIDEAVEALKGRNILVVTGAGVSTDSGIPDYRGKGMLAKFPLYADKFASDPIWRKKFWIRSLRQWPEWSEAEPNSTHMIVSAFEREGMVTGVVTQNVDGLHHMAGSMNVAEVHGNMFSSSCMNCNKWFDQFDVVDKAWEFNPKLANKRVIAKTFIEPMCDACGGFLKPDVVFFDDYILPDQYELGETLAKESDAVLVLGTSMVVGTAAGFVYDIKKRGPVVVINRGRTMVDEIADVKISGGLADHLPLIGEELMLERDLAGVS